MDIWYFDWCLGNQRKIMLVFLFLRTGIEVTNFENNVVKFKFWDKFRFIFVSFL